MSDILELCAQLPVKVLQEDEVLLQEGASTGKLYVLLEGTVEVLKGDFQVNVVSHPGSFFGEISVLLDLSHMATVKAVEQSRFYVVEDALNFLESNPHLALAVGRLVASRLQQVTTYLVDLKNQFEDHEDHLGMVDQVLESLLHNQSSPNKVTPGSDREYEPNI